MWISARRTSRSTWLGNFSRPLRKREGGRAKEQNEAQGDKGEQEEEAAEEEQEKDHESNTLPRLHASQTS